MKAKHAILSLLFIVIIFVSKGFYTNYAVKMEMENVYKEFNLVTNTLSPLFDSYALLTVDSQVKAAHGLITTQEYNEILKKASDIQKRIIKEYAEIVKNEESIDDKELFLRSTEVYAYINKMMELCKKNDVAAIHQSLYSGEMYKIIDPITACINNILENRFKQSEVYRKEASKAIENHDKVMIFASVLAAILIVAVLNCKNCVIGAAVKKKYKNFTKKK